MPLFRLFCAVGALLGVALLAGWVLRPKLKFTADVPDHAVAGQPLRVEVRVANSSRFPAWNVGAGFFEPARELTYLQQPALAAIAPGGQARISAALLPSRRGMYSVKLRVFSTFPFDLLRFPRALPLQHSLLVMPTFQPLLSVDLPVSARYQPGGIALTSNIGESPEYIGNREYQYGDSMRRIDFRAWARLARPAVREYQEEYYCRIALILDTHVPFRAFPVTRAQPQLEAAISLCAAVADVLARGEYIIDLFAAGPELYVFRAGRHTAHFENVLEILACVDACHENPFENVTPALVDELGSISAVLGIFLDWDTSREQMMQAALEQGCAARAIIVRDGPTTMPCDAGDIHTTFLTPAQVQDGALESL